MKILKQTISMFLVFALLAGMMPAQALAATDSFVIELRFYSDCESPDYQVLDQESNQKIVFNYGHNPYKFAIQFADPESVGYAYITSTVNNVKKVLDAVYNEDTGLFETSGYFDESNPHYEPQQVRVEYSRKSTGPAVGTEMDMEEMKGQLGEDLQNSTVDNVNDGENSSGTVNMTAVETVMNYYVKTVDGSLGTELGTMRDYYNTAANVLAYTVPGIDDSRYHAYLDLSDPDNLKMMLDDGLDAGGKAIEISLEFLDESGEAHKTLSDVSKTLSATAPVVNTLKETYNIHSDMENLRTELETIDYANPDDKEAAAEAVNALEADQIAFAILVTALPLIATGGAAAGPSVALFTAMIGVMNKASDNIYQHRIGTIKEQAVAAELTSNTIGGQIGDSITWVASKSEQSLSIRGTGPLPNYSKGGPWPQYFKDDEGNITSFQTLTIGEGITYLGTESFYNTSFTSVSLPHSLEKIAENAFYSVSGIKNITLPEGLTELNANAFYLCHHLESITLPNTLTYVGGNPVKKCNNFTDVYFDGNVSQFESIDGYQSIDPLFDDTLPYTLHVDPSGVAGTDVSWRFFKESGTLTISGSGTIYPLYENPGNSDDIRAPWSRFQEQITQVIIYDGITGICTGVFQDHTAMETISIPNSVKEIGASPFSGCTSLKEITLPESAVSPNLWLFSCTALEKASILGSHDEIYISNCTSLTDTTFSDNASALYFLNCTAVKTLDNLPGQLEKFTANNAASLEKVVLPEGTKEAYFTDCPALKSVEIPDSVQTLIFENCSSLKSVEIPGAAEEMVFENCTSLKTVTMKAPVKTSEFRNCPELEAAVFLGGSQKITLVQCTKLKTVTIPSSVTCAKIYDCTGLTQIHYGSSPEAFSQNVTDNSDEEHLETVTVHYTSEGFCDNGLAWDFDEQTGTLTIQGEGEMGDCWLYPAHWIDYMADIKSIVIKEGVTTVADGAFAPHFSASNRIDGIYCDPGYTSLTSVKLPSTLTTIGEQAFAGCTALTYIDLPDGITRIGEGAFAGCVSLSQIELPDDVPAVPRYTFEGCSALTEVILPVNLTGIYAGAFKNCTSMKRIRFLSDAPYFNSMAFQSVTADAYYPADNSTWTQDVLQDYCGFITWHPDTEWVETGLTERYIQQQMDAGYTHINIHGTLTLKNDFDLPGGITLELDKNSHLIIPDGKTFKLNGGILYCCGGLGDMASSIVVKKGGTLTGSGLISIFNGKNSLIVEEGGTLIGGGSIYCYNHATIEIQGIWQLNSSAQIQDTASLINTGTIEVHNTGRLKYSGTIQNDGKIVICGEELLINDGGTWIGNDPETDLNLDPIPNPGLTPDPTPTVEFKDVPADQYYYAPVQWAVAKEITNGYGAADTFAPDLACTRGQIVTFLWRANGAPEPKSSVNPFTDVAESDYFYKAVLWAVENEITAGYGSDTIFNPDGECTRAQVATFLWRAEGEPAPASSTNPFTDVAAGQYYYDAVLWAVEQGITNGYGSDDVYAPDITCTRGQIVTFLYRAIAE